MNSITMSFVTLLVMLTLQGAQAQGQSQSQVLAKEARSAPGTDQGATYSVSDPPAPSPEQAVWDESGTMSQSDSFEDCFDSTWNDPCPCVYFQINAIFLQRVPRLSNQPIVVDDSTGTTLLSNSDLEFNFDPGIQATFGWRLCNGRTVELDYFGLFSGNASASIVTPGPGSFLIFSDNLVGNVFVDVDRVDVEYSSSLHSFAANLLCCCGCCDSCDSCESCSSTCSASADSSCGTNRSCQSVSWFAGFRYISLNEQMDILAQRDELGGVEEGSYNVRTSNNLYGGQLGAKLRRTQGRFGWEAMGFGGIFYNDAQQSQSVTDFPNFLLRPTVSSRSGGVAFVSGANLSALYALSDVWNLRAGYNLLWIEGAALAPNQLDFDFADAQGGSRLHNNGGLFLHGANVGLEARW